MTDNADTFPSSKERTNDIYRYCTFYLLLRQSEKFSQITTELFSALDDNSINAVTSAITLTEILIKPYQKNDGDLIEKYLLHFRSGSNLKVHPITESIAIRAAQLRASYPSIKTIDSLQVATALSAGIKIFLTNDFQLKQIKELTVVTLSDLEI